MSILCNNPACPDYGQQNSTNIVRNGLTKQGKQRYLCTVCRKTFVPAAVPPTNPNQVKKAKSGCKSLRGRPEYYDEVKGKTTLALTPTATEALQNLSKKYNFSKSELIERFCRGTSFHHPISSSIGVCLINLKQQNEDEVELNQATFVLAMILRQIATHWSSSSRGSDQPEVQISLQWFTTAHAQSVKAATQRLKVFLTSAHPSSCFTSEQASDMLTDVHQIEEYLQAVLQHLSELEAVVVSLPA